MGRLVLHIGMHKTGSSAIQHAFSRWRGVIGLSGVDYPMARGPDGRRLPKHNDLFLAIAHEIDHGRAHPRLGSSRTRVERIAALVARKRCVLISAEGLSGTSPHYADACAPLATGEVRVVVCLRRAASWAPAFHAQMVRSREVREVRPLGAWLEDEDVRAHLDLAGLLGRWADVFGRERIVPVVWRAGQDILPPFLEAADLPRWIARLPRASRAGNPSPPPGWTDERRAANAKARGLPWNPDRDVGDALHEIEAAQRAGLERAGYGALAETLFGA
ncbi:MAG: hypothetical protein ACPGID_08480 [Rubricella sp.]